MAIPYVTTRATLAAFFGDKILGTIWAWDAQLQLYVIADNEEIDPKRGVWVYAPELCGILLQ